jgi:vacuolar-type H+-ATPase subunit H
MDLVFPLLLEIGFQAGDIYMVTAPEKPEIAASEPELILEEFRQRLISSLRKEKENLLETADKEAKLILTKAYQEATSLTEKAKAESRQIINRTQEQSCHETEQVLTQAQKEAEKIISNTEESARREAREKTRKEVDSILRNTKEEAAKQTAKALQAAKEEAANIIGEAKKEAALVARRLLEEAEKEAREIGREARELKRKAIVELAETQKKTSEAVEQAITAVRQNAIDKAEKEAAEIVVRTQAQTLREKESILATTAAEAQQTAEAETARILQKAKGEAEEIINTARNKVRTQIEESSRLMLEIQQRMQQVIGTAGGNGPFSSGPPSASSKPEPFIAPAGEKSNSIPATCPTLKKDVPEMNETQKKINSLFAEEEKQTYQGRLKIDIAPPADSGQIAQLEQSLMKAANLRVVAKGGAEDGSAWIEIDLAKPAALLDILKRTPNVKDVVGAKSYIIVAVKSKQTG